MWDSDRFEIEAKGKNPSNATEAQLLAMFQQLLIERFDLKFHRETADRPGFALMVGRKGLRLKPESEDTTAKLRDQLKPAPNRPVTLVAHGCSMVNLLSQLGQSPIIDKTVVEGEDDFTLQWDEDQGPTLRTAFVIESAQMLPRIERKPTK